VRLLPLPSTDRPSGSKNEDDSRTPPAIWFPCTTFDHAPTVNHQFLGLIDDIQIILVGLGIEKL